MSAPIRLVLFGVGLAAIFVAAYATAAAVVPDDAVDTWHERSGTSHSSPTPTEREAPVSEEDSREH